MCERERENKGTQANIAEYKSIYLKKKDDITAISLKMIILSLFTQPRVIFNLCNFLSSEKHKRRDFEECW